MWRAGEIYVYIAMQFPLPSLGYLKVDKSVSDAKEFAPSFPSPANTTLLRNCFIATYATATIRGEGGEGGRCCFFSRDVDVLADWRWTAGAVEEVQLTGTLRLRGRPLPLDLRPTDVPRRLSITDRASLSVPRELIAARDPSESTLARSLARPPAFFPLADPRLRVRRLLTVYAEAPAGES